VTAAIAPHRERATMTREKVNLTGGQETLLITLYAKAEESRLPDSLLRDTFAVEVVRRLDYDFSKLKVDRDVLIGSAIRAKTFDTWTAEFIARTPDATVLHLGCGLDSRLFRLDPPASVRWFEVDYPNVIELRQRVYPVRAGCRLVASSVTAPDWLRAVPTDRPAMIIAEGLLPYLGEQDVPALLDRLTTHLPSGELIFDGYSRLGVRIVASNRSIRATGESLGWSIDDPRQLERLVPRLRLITDLTPYDPVQVARMSWPTRAAAFLFEAVPALQRVARLLRYRF
jgi:O-methyltransferase involved in polyketide biosynthesis